MLVGIEGEPSCLVLPGEGRGGDGWIVGELDKIGYRGVESAVYHFDAFHSAGAEVLGDEAGGGRPADARRARRRPRQRRLPRAGDHRPRPRARAHRVPRARDRRRRPRRPHARAAARGGDGRAPRGRRVAHHARRRWRSTRATTTPASFRPPRKVVASDSAVEAVDAASRLAASRSYTAADELARLRRDAPQTQIGEGANDALLFALARNQRSRLLVNGTPPAAGGPRAADRGRRRLRLVLATREEDDGDRVACARGRGRGRARSQASASARRPLPRGVTDSPARAACSPARPRSSRPAARSPAAIPRASPSSPAPTPPSSPGRSRPAPSSSPAPTARRCASAPSCRRSAATGSASATRR